MLEALMREHSNQPLIYPTLPNDLDVIRKTYARACTHADLVISSGGVSVGDRDFTRQMLKEYSKKMKFWKITMKPGKPLAFGVASDGNKQTPLIKLPKNPASNLICFHQFVKPALSKLQGME